MHFTLPIPATDAAIERPIIFQITKDLVDEGTLPKIKYIKYKGINASIQKRGSNTPDCEPHNYSDKDSFIQVQTESKYISKPNVIRLDYKYGKQCFSDEIRRIRLSSLRRRIEVNIKYSCVTTSLELLRSYRKTMNQVLTGGRTVKSHTVDYHFTMPHRTWDFLGLLHRDMETDQSLTEWFKANAENGMALITAGTHYEVAFKERQYGVDGFFKDKPSEIGKGEKTGRYRIDVEYSIQYDLPDTMFYQYPVIVDQTTIDPSLLPKPDVLPPMYYNATPLHRLPYVESKGPTIVRYPEFDSGDRIRVPSGYEPMMSILLSFDKDLPRDCFNMHEMGDVELNPLFLDSLELNWYEDLTNPYKTPFLLTLHQNDENMSEDSLVVDEHLSIETKEDITRSSVYRITLSILTEPRLLGDVLPKLNKDCVMLTLYTNSLKRFGVSTTVRKSILENIGKGAERNYERCIRRRITDCMGPLGEDELETTIETLGKPAVRLAIDDNRAKTVMRHWVRIINSGEN